VKDAVSAITDNRPSNKNPSIHHPTSIEKNPPPPPPEILLMEEILHQLRLVVYPIIDRVFNFLGGAGFLPSTVAVVHFIPVPH